MSATPPESPTESETFSWERWLLEGLRHLRHVLCRYDLGLPEEFWQHLERAARELLQAARILLKTLRHRLHPRPATTPTRGPVDIEWESS
jgi:hypothetical protein